MTERIDITKCDACGDRHRPKETQKRDGIVVVICVDYGPCIAHWGMRMMR